MTTRLDATDLAFIERQLEQVRAKTYDVQYPELKARQLIPVDNEVDPGAESVKYEQWDRVGVAKLLSAYSQDLPRSDVSAKEFRATIKGMGNSYGYSIQDLRAAKLSGRPLDQKRAAAARRAFEELVDKIGATGDSANVLEGLLNITSAQTYTIPSGAGGHTDWARKTGLEILADLVGIATMAQSTTNDIEISNTMVMPIDQLNLIKQKPLFTSGVTTTVYAQFLATNDNIKSIVSWYKCKGAGDSSSDRVVCYTKSPDKLALIIPQEFEQFAEQQKGLTFEVPCHGRIGGVVSYYPLSIIYADHV